MPQLQSENSLNSGGSSNSSRYTRARNQKSLWGEEVVEVFLFFSVQLKRALPKGHKKRTKGKPTP